MKLLNVIKIITTCDSQVDHNMWVTKVTSITNNCDKFVNQIITNSFGIQKTINS
jgi:hypothetical protein